ncbi:large subunit ribosomal protein L7Ae [Vigna unguiculata]|uniref:Large subunit ribosomal protein L7Ae n=1 Tax=Vigna unguiculata TaxID=3917 RepID=A0A4D6KXH4_VIGUN|nr:large subunit ribosomal protein L7Ae [Vigna unguiculata]
MENANGSCSRSDSRWIPVPEQRKSPTRRRRESVRQLQKDSGIQFRSSSLLNRYGGKSDLIVKVCRALDDGRPVESGENNHAVSEFEVLRTEIVVWSAPPEDVTSAPVDDARNEDTEIGSDEGEVVDSLRRCGEEEVGVKNVGTGEEEDGGENVGTGEEEGGGENVGKGEEEVGGENVGTGEEEGGGENVGKGEEEVGGENVGTGEEEGGGENVGKGEEEVGGENVGTGEEEGGGENVGKGEEEVGGENVGTGEEEGGGENVGKDCIGDSDGDKWGCGNGGTEGVVDVEIDVDYVAAPTPPAPGPPPNTAVQQPSQPSYGIRKMRPKMQIRRPPRPSAD